MSDKLFVGILGASHAATAITANLKEKDIEPVMWAPPNHLGVIPMINQNRGILRAKGAVNGLYLFDMTHNLCNVVESCRFIIMATCSDAHEAYVAELVKYNDKLLDTDLFMICGQGFTIIYEECLKVKRIFESNTSPAASKLDGLAIVDIKKMKTNFQVSCFPLCNGGADLPADVKPILDWVFHATLSPCTPLEIALGSTVVTHVVTALLNMGHLEDTVNSLTSLTCSFHSMLQACKAADLLPFFYSKGMNNPVCNAQLAFDTECLKIGEVCGLQLVDLLTDCNSEHGTSYANLHEYSLAPEPHNVQKAAPQDIKHCYYAEELLPMVFIHSLTKILSIDLPVITGTIHFYQAALRTDAFASDQNLGSLQVGCEDLVHFSTKFPA